MKTLPEILARIYATNEHYVSDGGYDMTTVHGLEKATESIAKELMGCLPEKEAEIQPMQMSGAADFFRTQGRNQAISEVRARLTAFIGEIEK